jgi:tetratricopeptide (TPR) repeat protein
VLSCLHAHATVVFGQARLANNNPPTAGTFNVNTLIVSARELSIPEKARKAFYTGTQCLAAKGMARRNRRIPESHRAFGDLDEACYKIGMAQWELQRGPEAEAGFRKAIELSDGRYAPPLFGLGLALSNAGPSADAVAAVRAGLDPEPVGPGGHFTRAWVLYAANKFGDADKSALEAIRHNPNFAVAHLFFAQIHRRQNNQEALIADLDAFLMLEPNGLRSHGAREARAQAQLQIAAATGDRTASANR